MCGRFEGCRHREARLNDVKEREIQGTRHRLQAPVLPEPQGFSLPSFEVKGTREALPHA